MAALHIRAVEGGATMVTVGPFAKAGRDGGDADAAVAAAACDEEQRKSRRRFALAAGLFCCCGLAMVAIALGLGLGLGLNTTTTCVDRDGGSTGMVAAEPPAMLGRVCATTADCVDIDDVLLCDGGLCRYPIGYGPCYNFDHCVSGADSFCDTGARVCSALVRPSGIAGAGAVCARDADCTHGGTVCSGGVCVFSLGNGPCTTAAECSAAAAMCAGTALAGGRRGACSSGGTGDRCDTHSDCSAPGTVCDSTYGICKVGASASGCSYDYECESGAGLVCVGDVCGLAPSPSPSRSPSPAAAVVTDPSSSPSPSPPTVASSSEWRRRR
jgi:hypothetical protein